MMCIRVNELMGKWEKDEALHHVKCPSIHRLSTLIPIHDLVNLPIEKYTEAHGLLQSNRKKLDNGMNPV